MKVAFSDFWSEFNYSENFFLDLLRNSFNNIKLVSLDQEPDVLFYSCFGKDHQKFNNKQIKKIWYTGENIKPDYSQCTYSISFDSDTHEGKNYRFPVWMLDIDWFKKGKDYNGYINPDCLHSLDTLKTNSFYLEKKQKFCSFVFGNPSKYRHKTVELFSKNYKRVDCYGYHFDKQVRGQRQKMKTISNYKFNICYENSLSSGYHTEKLFQAKVAGCVPIYWGHKSVEKDFNPACFINLIDFNENIDQMIEYVKRVDSNKKLYQSYISADLFTTKPTIGGLVDYLCGIL